MDVEEKELFAAIHKRLENMSRNTSTNRILCRMGGILRRHPLTSDN